MRARPLVLAAALLSMVAGGAACSSGPDLKEALEVTDILSGYYDDGVTASGENRLLPSITFRLKNVAQEPVSHVDVTVAFWQEGKDGPLDDKQIRAITDAVAPGAATEALTVRSGFGYTLAQPRAELFTHTMFTDFTAKLFARRGGRIYPMGEFKLDRRILPQVQRTSGRP